MDNIIDKIILAIIIYGFVKKFLKKDKKNSSPEKTPGKPSVSSSTQQSEIKTGIPTLDNIIREISKAVNPTAPKSKSAVEEQTGMMKNSPTENEMVKDEEHISETFTEEVVDEESHTFDQRIKKWDDVEDSKSTHELKKLDRELETAPEIQIKKKNKMTLPLTDASKLRQAVALNEVINKPASKRKRHPYAPIYKS